MRVLGVGVDKLVNYEGAVVPLEDGDKTHFSPIR